MMNLRIELLALIEMTVSHYLYDDDGKRLGNGVFT
jgi:hypothetical protein